MEQIERLQKVIDKLNLISDLDVKMKIDKRNNIVNIGEDIFKIKWGMLKSYLNLKIKKYELLIDMHENPSKYTLGSFASIFSRYTIEATRYYRED